MARRRRAREGEDHGDPEFEAGIDAQVTGSRPHPEVTFTTDEPRARLDALARGDFTLAGVREFPTGAVPLRYCRK